MEFFDLWTVDKLTLGGEEQLSLTVKKKEKKVETGEGDTVD